ncbi:MAG: tetratricopeptide repeat protein, partial [Geminicoccales bacterium]
MAEGTARLVLAAADAPPQVTDAAPEESAYGAYLAGLHADRSRDLSAAADFMLTAWEADRDNTALLSGTFMLVAADGRFEKAVELARLLMMEMPDHPSAGLVLLVEAAEREDYDKAEELLASLPQRGVNTLLGPVLGAWLALARDKPDLAFERLDKLTGTEGFAIIHQLHRALIYDFRGRKSEASAAYQALLDEADAPALRLVLLAGNFFERNGEAARAETHYAKLREEDSDTMLLDQAFARIDAGEKPRPPVTSIKEGLAEALFSLASLLGQERADDMALLHVHLALELRPDFEVAQVLLGELLQAQGRSE